jgi:DME family drug/metabolite transporter
MRTTAIKAEPRRGIIYVSISGILWGTIGISAQAIYLQSEVTSLAIGFYRLAIGFPIVAMACFFLVGREVFQVKFRHYVQMALIGAMLALYQAAYFSAINYVGVSTATLITLCSAPVVVSMASALFLNEPITRYTLAALILAVIGTGLLVGAPGAILDSKQLLWGVGLSIVSATGYAAVALMGRALSGVCHPVHSTAVSFMTGAFILLPFVTFSGEAINYSGEVFGLLLYLGLIPTAVGYLLFFSV